MILDDFMIFILHLRILPQFERGVVLNDQWSLKLSFAHNVSDLTSFQILNFLPRKLQKNYESNLRQSLEASISHIFSQMMF